MVEPEVITGTATKVASVKFELTVTTADGRTHCLDVLQSDPTQVAAINYMGNNILLDKELAKIVTALGRANYGLI